MFCPQCGEKNTDESRFCSCCGNPLHTFPANPPEEIPAAPRKGRLWPPLVILAVLFAAGLALFLWIRMPAAATDPQMPWFSVQDGVLYFDADLYTGSSELTVPAVIAGQQVTAISDRCFSGSTDLTAVFLPEGISHIGDSAFAQCSSLRGILIPESVKSLGLGVFYNCRKLEAVCIPYAVKTAGADIFAGCTSLRHVFYPGPMEAWEQLRILPPSGETRIYCHDGTMLPQ